VINEVVEDNKLLSGYQKENKKENRKIKLQVIINLNILEKTEQSQISSDEEGRLGT